MSTSNRIAVFIKILPPFTRDMKTNEKTYYLQEGSTLLDLLNILIKEGDIASRETLLTEDNSLKNNVVIMINGLIIHELSYKLKNSDRVVIMPLVYGGYLANLTPLVKAAPAATNTMPVTTH